MGISALLLALVALAVPNFIELGDPVPPPGPDSQPVPTATTVAPAAEPTEPNLSHSAPPTQPTNPPPLTPSGPITVSNRSNLVVENL